MKQNLPYSRDLMILAALALPASVFLCVSDAPSIVQFRQVIHVVVVIEVVLTLVVVGLVLYAQLRRKP